MIQTIPYKKLNVFVPFFNWSKTILNRSSPLNFDFSSKLEHFSVSACLTAVLRPTLLLNTLPENETSKDLITRTILPT